MYEFVGLFQSFVHFTEVVGEGHFRHPFLTQWAEAFFLQQLSDLVETYLLFKVLWIYHGLILLFCVQKYD